MQPVSATGRKILPASVPVSALCHNYPAFLDRAFCGYDIPFWNGRNRQGEGKIGCFYGS
ncbi:MAG: hypothetical protein ABF968_05950 [Acetobacter sp.]